MLLLLFGCGGPSDETLLDELRVLAIVAEPPEVPPGAAATLTTTVVDPGGVDPEIVVWTCTPFGSGCLETGLPGLGARAGRLTDGAFVDERVAPAELAAVVGDGTTVLPVFTWVLACDPGLCPLYELAEASPTPGTSAADELGVLLADPLTMMEDLPLTGTSLATGRVSVSTRATPVVNPVLRPEFTTVDAAAGDSARLDFGVDGGETAYGFTTAGGFGAPEYAVEDGAVSLEWFAPDESAGNTDLFVVVNGPDGGSALWQGAAARR